MRIYSRHGKYRLYWYVDYYENGRRIRRSYKSKAEAEAFRDGRAALKIRHLLDETTSIRHESDIKLSWSDLMARYFKYTQNTHQPQTVKKDIGRIKAFNNFIQHRNIKHLDQITIGLVAEFQAEYLNDHSRKSCNNLIGLVKTMLNRAVDWELIAKNPIAKFKPLKIDHDFNWYSKDDLTRIIENCPKDIRDAVIILANTGLRRGELF